MLEARVTLPPSKSVINRLAVIRALTPGADRLPESLAQSCADTQVIVQALSQPASEINVADSGTALRLLTAYFATKPGAEATLTGSRRLCSRPVGPLVDALRALGADITYIKEEGVAPISIKGRKLDGGEVNIDAGVSSQFITALMLVAPTMPRGLKIHFDGEPVSAPYIRLTLQLMQQHGIECEMERTGVSISPGEYRDNGSPAVEADWSAASYWYEIAALSGGFVTLDADLRPDSAQADARGAKIFEDLGVHTNFEGEEGGIDLELTPEASPRLRLDMDDCPDLVPTIAVTASMLGIPYALSGIDSLRIKESDRVEVIIHELRKIGIFAEAVDGTLTWELQRMQIRELPRFDAHGDHRIAMALAPAALFLPGIVIEGAEAVDKSYPGFWDELRRAGFTLTDGDEPYTPGDGFDDSNPEQIRGSEAVL